jgi:hypothetical protein
LTLEDPQRFGKSRDGQAGVLSEIAFLAKFRDLNSSPPSVYF